HQRGFLRRLRVADLLEPGQVTLCPRLQSQRWTSARTEKELGYPGNDLVWVATFTIFCEYPSDDRIRYFADEPAIFVNRDGTALKLDGRLVTSRCEETDLPALRDSFSVFILPCLYALTLMHCRNVTLEKVTTPLPLSNKKSKRRKQIEERKKLPPFERHTIVIRDRKGRSVQTGLRQEGAARGLHIVRGHFHTYTPERPLFGNPKLHGRFWVPAHLSGLNPERVIESDYRLEVA
ncbi:MAG: hypothetical protein WCF30_19120, partial [Terracidiphilus sp.]